MLQEGDQDSETPARQESNERRDRRLSWSVHALLIGLFAAILLGALAYSFLSEMGHEREAKAFVAPIVSMLFGGAWLIMLYLHRRNYPGMEVSANGDVRPVRSPWLYRLVLVTVALLGLCPFIGGLVWLLRNFL